MAFDVADAGKRVGKGDIVVEGGSEGDSRRLSVAGNGIGDVTCSSPLGKEVTVSGGEGSRLCGASGIGRCGSNGSGRFGIGVTRFSTSFPNVSIRSRVIRSSLYRRTFFRVGS